jgi:hypothetical protein
MSAETDIQFEVWQDGFMVAAADDIPNAQHYMVIYGQDGSVEAKTAITTRFPGFNLVSAAASPVVPVGARERVRRIVSGWAYSLPVSCTVAAREEYTDRKTDAIIAALRPTDTGRE